MEPETHNKMGRPPKGSTTMTKEIKIRLEPGLAQRLEAASRKTHKPKVELIREAIRMYLQKLEQWLGQDYY